MSGTAKLSFIIISLSLIYAFAYPAFGDISILNEKKKSYEESLATLTEIDNKKNELLTEYNQIPEVERKNVETLLPNSADFVKLAAEIDNVASRNGVIIERVSSKETSSSGGSSIQSAGPEKIYRSALISLAFKAPYGNFKGFIKELEESLRILDVRSVRVDAGEKSDYSYNAEFEIYFLKS